MGLFLFFSSPPPPHSFLSPRIFYTLQHIQFCLFCTFFVTIVFKITFLCSSNVLKKKSKQNTHTHTTNRTKEEKIRNQIF
eukprot:UN02445